MGTSRATCFITTVVMLISLCSGSIFNDIWPGQCNQDGYWKQFIRQEDYCSKNSHCPRRFYCDNSKGSCQPCTRESSVSENTPNPGSNCADPVPNINYMADGYEKINCPKLIPSNGSVSIGCAVKVKSTDAPLNTMCKLELKIPNMDPITVYACCAWNTTSNHSYWVFNVEEPSWIDIIEESMEYSSIIASVSPGVYVPTDDSDIRASSDHIIIGICIIVVIVIIAIGLGLAYYLCKKKENKNSPTMHDEEQPSQDKVTLLNKSAESSPLTPPSSPETLCTPLPELLRKEPEEGDDRSSSGIGSNPSTDTSLEPNSSYTNDHTRHTGISSTNDFLLENSRPPQSIGVPAFVNTCNGDNTAIKSVDDDDEQSSQDVDFTSPDHDDNMVGRLYYGDTHSIDSYQHQDSLTDQPDSNASNRTGTSGYETESLKDAFVSLPDTGPTTAVNDLNDCFENI